VSELFEDDLGQLGRRGDHVAEFRLTLEASRYLKGELPGFAALQRDGEDGPVRGAARLELDLADAVEVDLDRNGATFGGDVFELVQGELGLAQLLFRSPAPPRRSRSPQRSGSPGPHRGQPPGQAA